MSNTEDNDDEFDDLFSFSGNAGPGVTNTNTNTSAMTIATATATAATTSGSGSGSSANTSESGSYCKVTIDASSTPPSDDNDNDHDHDDFLNDNDHAVASSNTSTNKNTNINTNTNTTGKGTNEDEDDDIFGEFNLENINLGSTPSSNVHVNALKEEDFNGMDEGTREFLDFLDKDPKSSAAAVTKDDPNDAKGQVDVGVDVDDDFLMEGHESNANSARAQVKVLNDAGDILAGLESDSDEESGAGGAAEEDDEKQMQKQMQKQGGANISSNNDKGTSGADTENANSESSNKTGTSSNGTVVTESDFVNVNVNVNVNVQGSNPDLDPTTMDITTIAPKMKMVRSKSAPVSPTKSKTRTSSSSSSKNMTRDDQDIFKVRPTIVTIPKNPTDGKGRRSSSAATSLQSNSILEEEDEVVIIESYSIDNIEDSDSDGNDNDNGNAGSKDKNKKDDNEASPGEQNDKDNDAPPEEIKKEIYFESLVDALQSPESTMAHIRPFIYNPKLTILSPSAAAAAASSNATVSTATAASTSTSTSSSKTNLTVISPEDRPYLWSKVICSKVLSDVQSSSLVDTFMSWNENEFDFEKTLSKEKNYDLPDDFITKILEEIDLLACRICSGNDNDDDDDDNDVIVNENEKELFKAKRDLCSLLVFYYRRNSNLNSMKVNTFASILKKESQPLADELKEVTDGSHNETEDQENKGESEKTLQDSTVSDENEVGDIEEEKAEGRDEDKINDGHNVTESQPDINDDAIEKEHEDKNNTSELPSSVPTEEGTSNIEWKSLIGPIAATLLSANIPIEVSCVMLSKIISTLPLISLTKFERFTAVKSLHQQLYFLVCYHLPLLVLHLDRYAPGWHWPRVLDGDEGTDEMKGSDEDSPTYKSRNLEAHGTIPITWFASLLAGEGTSETLKQTKLLSLWDILLTCDDQSLKFFLALALLEKHSDALMMLRGQDLINELSAVLSFKNNSKIQDESFMGDKMKGEELPSSKRDDCDEDFVLNWYRDAKALQESTPSSVASDLCKAEDIAVNHILTMRSKIAMEKMRARLEAEANAHRKAVEEENAKKAEERLHQYYKKRLDKFYDRHCPDKKDNVEKILETYKDRYQELNNKLAQKYGSGFLPLLSVLNPRLKNQTNKLISTVGQGIETRKKNIVASRAKERADKLDEDIMGPGAHKVAINVAPSEILPLVCTGKAKQHNTHESLKYYLVDSRPDETVKVQGAFPTSVRLSPEDLMEPERIQEKVEMFESLRGAVHICIMGEGFSSFPALYNHPLSQIEEKLLENDESRTNMCALFFIKKGFPFISVLEGGFAAAHSWLARDCDHLNLTEVLVDYDDKASLFADLERSYQAQKEFSNASTRRKTALALRKLIDNSMTRLTLLENRIEEFTDRPRTRANEDQAQEEENDTSKSTSIDEMENEMKANEPDKLPPMKLFQGMKTAVNNKTNSTSENPDESNAEQKKSGDEAKEGQTGNMMKAGFGKALTGFKNIRANRPSKVQDEDVEKVEPQFRMPLRKKDKDGEPNNVQSPFNFRKINLSRKNNIFTAKKTKQISKEDDDLEKEIEASLTKPQELVSISVENTKGGKAKEDSVGQRSSVDRSFKNPLKKITFGKFNSITSRRPAKPSSQSIIREEESLFFEEESLDGVEDIVEFDVLPNAEG